MVWGRAPGAAGGSRREQGKGTVLDVTARPEPWGGVPQHPGQGKKHDFGFIRGTGGTGRKVFFL